MTAELIRHVTEWIAHDPDPACREALERRLSDERFADLAESFNGRLVFGTAGLRGKLGAGPNRMNRAVVIQTTKGVADYLLSTVDGASRAGVVIGYDGRRQSDVFARDAAEVLAAAGIKVYLFDVRVPTPLLAFSVLKLKTAAGIMITASHNPPAYNGYKLYWGNGAQITPPHDSAISDAIDVVGWADEISRFPLEQADVHRCGQRFFDDYTEAVLKTQLYTGSDGRDVTYVYTAMHGVGYQLLSQVLEAAAYPNLHNVEAQAAPDGEFPTVTLPNPEEPSALKLALELAAQVDADLILANDPDADRLAVVARDSTGAFRKFSGDEIGSLLGDHIVTQLKAQGRLPENGLLETTVVSSSQLGKLAAHHGLRYEETLTGFKWIANRALELENSDGVPFLFGYEEAIGYTVGTLVRDKDGISAALYILEMAALAKQAGETLFDRLDRIHKTLGVHLKKLNSYVLEGREGKHKIVSILDDLRRNPPRKFGELKVAQFHDYLKQESIDLNTGTTRKLGLPPSNLLVFEMADGSRVISRPSGTEPKIKFYFESIQSCDLMSVAAAKVVAEKKLQMMIAAMTAITGLS